MISVPPLRDSSGDDRDGDMGNCSMLNSFCDAAWLDMDISFDDLFVELYDEDILPDLEVDPAYKILSEFSVGREEDSEMTTTIEVGAVDATSGTVVPEGEKREEKDLSHGKEAVAVSATKKEEPTSPATDQGQKSCAAAAKGSQGKRKVKKVDWTPQLHRRFVQAVEQLGIDKAVPSRILELMDIDCLTRHNIASHLQKYRSHRKHSLVREAENASWNQRRQKYTASTATREGGNPWLGTIAFPPPPPPSPVYPFRPLHVWGHPPPADPPLVHVWPRHVTPPWAPRSPLPPYQREGREGWILAHAMAQGTPCLISQPRSPAPFVAAILPHPMCRAAPPAMSKHSECSQLLLDAHPSKECIDAAVGDVLAKPWSPLPIGLRPPSLESMLVELQKQGVLKVPP